VTGPAAQVTDGVATIESEGNASYALSDTGTLVFATRVPPERRTLAWVDRAGNTSPLPLEPRMYWTPQLSPDDKQLAVVVRDGDDSHIWIHHFERGTLSRLTQEGQNWSPVWTADSAALFYVSEKDGRTQIVRQAADGSAAPEVLLKSEGGEFAPGDLTRDGRSVVFTVRSPTGASEIRLLDLASRSTQTLRDLPDRVAMPVLSPDGRWLGFTGWTSVRPSIFVKPIEPAGPPRMLVEAAGYTVWSRTGDRLYFRTRRGAAGGATDGVFELPFDPIKGVVTGPERQLFRKAFTDWLGVPGFDVAADGRFLLVLSDEREAQPRELSVVLHVDDELRRRTP
jgi:Tol biopolymer transport system component